MFIRKKKPEELSFTMPGLWIVNVDSDIALTWLKLNVGNRRVRKTLVAYLARQISTGEWQSNHPQPVVFSNAGRLIDGQHRLTAIAESDIYGNDSVEIRVETGARDEIREYMDTGVSRTLDDRVQLHNDPKINKFATQLLGVDLLLAKGKAGAYGKATPDDAREWWSLHGESVVKVFDIHRSEKATGQASVSFAALEYFEIDDEKADSFYSSLFVPAGDVQQAQMLRDFLFRMVNARGGYAARKEIYQKSVGCMKAHMEGRTVGKVTRAAAW
jgi:hypothetical protein